MKVAKFEFSLFGINTYVVYDPESRKAAIIDPGMINEQEENAMANFVKREGLTVTHIINTHLHLDHAIGNKWASDTYQVPVYAHKDDEVLGSRLQTQALQFGVPKKVDEVTISSYLHDGEELKIGNGRLRVIHVPGHSPGGVALYDPEGGYVIAGDSLFAGSIGRTDLPGGDMSTLLSNIKEKLYKLPNETVVYSGHGPATTIGREKLTNPFVRE